jgi:hypothetical protein
MLNRKDGEGNRKGDNEESWNRKEERGNSERE